MVWGHSLHLVYIWFNNLLRLSNNVATTSRELPRTTTTTTLIFLWPLIVLTVVKKSRTVLMLGHCQMGLSKYVLFYYQAHRQSGEKPVLPGSILFRGISLDVKQNTEVPAAVLPISLCQYCKARKQNLKKKFPQFFLALRKIGEKIETKLGAKKYHFWFCRRSFESCYAHARARSLCMQMHLDPISNLLSV